MKENCRTCGGKGIIDIAQTWHELTVWCPECETKRFDGARNTYRRNYGIDVSKIVDYVDINRNEDVDNRR